MKLYAKWIEEGAEEETFPTVYITTADGNGNSLQKSTGYVSATIRIGTEISADGRVKVRGNSTSSGEKKPFAIKFSKKQNVFGMGAAKKWVLLANCFDPTLLRNYLALSMAQELGLDYTPEMRYVDLYMDGVYKGNYLLTEAVEADPERVNIDVGQGGFLLERDERYEADVTYLTSPVFHYRFAMKEPETPTDEEKVRILNTLFAIEHAMASGDFAQVARQVDVDSFVDFYILNEYMKSVDVGQLSVFFYFKNGKLYAGPVWDYDHAAGNANPDYYTAYYTEGESYKGIWAQGHWLGEMTKYAEFMQLVKYRYRSLQPYIRYIYVGNGFLDMSYAAHRSSFERNYTDAGWDVAKRYAIWSRQPDGTYEENYEYLRDWLRNRNEWLCGYWHVESAVLDYAGYWNAVAQTQGYSALCYEHYDVLEAALAVDVYREDITQDEIDAAAQDILDAIGNLREIVVYTAGMPYREENGTWWYDASVPHIVINQVYGGANKASYASHSFIELYNPTDEDVDLSTWSVQYRSSVSDLTASEAWKVHKLSGTIKAHHSYLICCGSVKDPVEGAIALTTYDEVWEQPLHNKGLSVVLLACQTQIDASSVVFDNVSKQPVVAGYIDLFAVSGNDKLDSQKVSYYETAASDVQSKKKTLRRVAFEDTDNNSINGDFEVIDYSFGNPDYLAWISPRCSADGAWDENTNIRPTFTVTYESNGGSVVEEEIYQLGTPICEPQPPVREWHVFEGWYRDADLTIKYDFSELPTENITFYAKWTRTEKEVVAISGIVIQDSIYTGREIAYSGTPVVTLQQDESITVPDVPLTYSYRGIRADRSDYFSDKAPVDAGEYILTVAVSEEDERYTGSTEYAFGIVPKELQLTAQDQTIFAGDSLPESYDYSLEGMIEGDELAGEPSFLCEVTDTSKAGTYAIEPYGACAGMNYKIVYNSGTLTIAEKIPGTGASDNKLVIQKIPDQIYTGSAIKPSVEVCSTGGILLKAGKDYTVKYFNNVIADTADEAFQGGTNPTGEEGVEGFTRKLAYVCIVGKGNYQGTAYHNFHINRVAIGDVDKNPADGFTLKCTDQLTRSDSRTQKPFASLKYKKSMRAGTDYMVKMTALTAYSENDALIYGEVVEQSKDQTIPAIPKGYHGSFLLTIEGIGNYTGTIEKIIYVADKNSIMKNAVITLGKNQKSVPYRQGEAVILTPGYYDMQTKEYYAMDEAGVLNLEAEKNRDNLFTVKLGNKYLIYGEDYTVTYTGNRAAGNATMTIEGIQEKGYFGSKSVIFRIIGTPFTARNISVDSATFHTTLPYTGKLLTQDQVLLKDMSADGKALVCGTDYTISYRNNSKRGTATMIFTAEPASGYTGSLKKTFQITKAPLEADMVTVTDSSKDRIVSENGSITLTGDVVYAKGGARPSERIRLVNQEGLVLREGTDYTISYTDNKTVTTIDTVKRPSMVIKGKGNYSGILKVSFEITAASMEDHENLTFTAAQMAYNPKREGDSGYQYRPKIRIMDGKQVLSATKDYQIYYGNCRQDEVKSYLDTLKSGSATEEELAAKRPYALITARDGSGYTTERGVVIPLTVYETRLTGQNIYIVISEDPKQTTYTGSQLRPEISVYYGDAAAVRAAKKAKETDAAVLTDEKGKYKLRRLKRREGNEIDGASDSVVGDYTLTYGTNVTAGKNKGSVVISGVGRYGGSVKVRFSIFRDRIV